MFADRVYETSTSTGTGALTLSGAVTGYRTFTTAFGAALAYYVIVNRNNPAEWEVGRFTVAGTTMTRLAANVLSGSAGAGTLVNFTAGTKDIFNAPPASQMTTWGSGGGGVTSVSNTGGMGNTSYDVNGSISGSVLTLAKACACNCVCCGACPP